MPVQGCWWLWRTPTRRWGIAWGLWVHETQVMGLGHGGATGATHVVVRRGHGGLTIVAYGYNGAWALQRRCNRARPRWHKGAAGLGHSSAGAVRFDHNGARVQSDLVVIA
ncbi:hypothetical protein GUJ93_ZPchr0002g23519 [Zizania palustris]|uniref:Secreted protein n=1 Tax=Zizania palustris TaxID=103762 RepID=A0A8J5SB82_ZIZPA|nr:hypothetical protein GUJ93_ZPchr0002g23519 [Zizania palustris]